MTLQQEIKDIKNALKFDRKYIMKRAWYLFKSNEFDNLSDALKSVWSEIRKFRVEKRIRLAQLEECLLIRTREAWSVQPTPSFIQTQAWKNGSIIK